MRYAEYTRTGRRHRPAGPTPTAPVQAPVDRLREAARTELFWVIYPEGVGVWTLRQLDDATGELSPPKHTSEYLGDSPSAGLDWGAPLVGIEAWRTMASYPGAHIEQAYDIVREIGRRPRTGRSIVARVSPIGQHPQLPDMTVLCIYERWATTGKLSEPLCTVQYDYANDEEMLRDVADWYGLAPDGWTTVVAGQEYEHH